MAAQLQQAVRVRMLVCNAGLDGLTDADVGFGHVDVNPAARGINLARGSSKAGHSPPQPLCPLAGPQTA